VVASTPEPDRPAPFEDRFQLQQRRARRKVNEPNQRLAWAGRESLIARPRHRLPSGIPWLREGLATYHRLQVITTYLKLVRQQSTLLLIAFLILMASALLPGGVGMAAAALSLVAAAGLLLATTRRRPGRQSKDVEKSPSPAAPASLL